MPKANNFLHAKYSRSDPGDRARYVSFEPGAPPFSPAWHDALGLLGTRIWDAGVRAVVLVYGSFLGADLFGSGRLDEVGGLKRGYSRGIPGLESLLAALRPNDYQRSSQDPSCQPPFVNDNSVKTTLDNLLNDKANFSEQYVNALRDGLASARALVVQRNLWSSLHHHPGRMEGAFALLHELNLLKIQLDLQAGDRILIVAHGHAGQLPALLSNLMAPGDSSVRETVFETLAYFYEQQETPSAAVQHLQELDRLLAENQLAAWPSLDVVTLGTPIRYGWDTDGLGKLLHIVNHRPIRQDGKRWLAKMELPQVVMEMPMASGGDYVHQLAVAGTDAVPASPWEVELDQALRENLEPYDGFERWLECARRVTRCPNDGQCLLIDYHDATGGSPDDHLFGHACYTRLNALLFQTSHVVDTLYGI
ncbi:MAG: hypothetical protein F4090_00655 [Nitrospira sp. SB0672_bin_25]|nr:hypothetical protein [Nitrospira sp. SB0678_bin_10]MYJ53427.1 hypothetical protein [Nitrospira sp. SB0672_bin_25]